MGCQPVDFRGKAEATDGAFFDMTPLRFVAAGALGSCDDTHVSRLPSQVLAKQIPRIKDTRSLGLTFRVDEPGSRLQARGASLARRAPRL